MIDFHSLLMIVWSVLRGIVLVSLLFILVLRLGCIRQTTLPSEEVCQLPFGYELLDQFPQRHTSVRGMIVGLKIGTILVRILR
jgi:hypothetical protein